MGLEFTVNWMGSHPPKWTKALKHLIGKPAQGLELGSYEGRSAIWFVENILTNPKSRLTCVDQFADSYAHRYYNNIVASDAFKKIITMRGDTHSIVSQLTGMYDFIYIDADHKAFATMRDICQCWPMLKPDGVLIMDDYEHKDYDCKLAIDFFLRVCEGHYEILEKGWQVIVKKTNQSVN